MCLFGRSRRSFKIPPCVRADLSRSGAGYTGVVPSASVTVVGTAGGGRTGGSGGLAANYAVAGRPGIGCFGIFGVMVFAGFCSAIIDGSGDSTPYSIPPSHPTAVDTAPSRWDRPQSTEIFYVHGEVNVRSGPGRSYPIIRTLTRGESVRLGPKDANGWAELFSHDGSREGYVYRASDLVRSSPPPTRTPRASSASSERTTSRSRSSAESRGYYTGPRGGCYTYSASGRKRYVDRSYCD